VDEQEKKPKTPRKGQFDSATPNNHNDGGVKSRKTILKAALRNGDLENSDWLAAFHELVDDHGLKDTEALTLLRIATDPDNRFLKFGHLVKGLEIIEILTARVKAARTPIVPALAKPDPTRQTQLLTDRAAILEGKLPVVPVVASKPDPIVTEKPAKPVDERPAVETPRPPNKFEQVHLPPMPIMDGYQSLLPGEGVTLTAAPAGSFREGFDKHHTINFEQTDHVGNSVIGNVIVKSPGIPTKVFPKVRQSYFKLWQSHNYEPKHAPDNMREEYRLFLQSLDSVILPTGQNTTPIIAESERYFSGPNDKTEYPRGVKVRRWGTAIDDAKKRGSRHNYGENPGADLAAMYAECDRMKGTEL
jgi:hypothetical protein